jgi:hypothetical protein
MLIDRDSASACFDAGVPEAVSGAINSMSGLAVRDVLLPHHL